MPCDLKNMKKKYSSIWRLSISSYCLPNLIEQVWLCLLERLIWHQSQGALYLPSAEKFSIKSLTAKLPTASFMVNNTNMVTLKNAKYKDKESMYWCFSYNYFIASIWISPYSRSRDDALLHPSWKEFPSHFSSYYLNSQLCISCFPILYTPSFFDHYQATPFTDLYHYLRFKWRLSAQSSSLPKTGLAVFSWLPHYTYASHFFWYC